MPRPVLLPAAQKRTQRRLKKMMSGGARTQGIVGLEDGTINVPNMNNYIWVRVNDARFAVFNNRISPVWGAPVWIGYTDLNPGLLQVLDYNYGAIASTFPPSVTAHGSTHTYWTGSDPVYIHLRAFLPFSPQKTGDFEITIFEGIFRASTGWVFIDDTVVDLTPHIPESSLGARYSLIYIDEDGVIQVFDGEMSTSLSLADIPDTPDNGFAICAVRLYSYQTGLVDLYNQSDIVDLRFPGESLGSILPSMYLDDLLDVNDPDPRDQYVLTYHESTGMWSGEPFTTSGSEILPARFEAMGNGSQTVFVLPNIFNPLTTRVYLNGLALSYPVEWDEFEEDTIQFSSAPLLGDLILVDYFPTIRSI